MKEIIQMLSKELKQLEHEFRVELPREISTAVAMGDLRENAEYHAALERQTFVKARIGQLRQRLGELNTMTLDRVPRDRIGLGSSVVLHDLDNDAEVEYELVFPEVADLDRGLISSASPIGRSLMGKKEGDTVSIEVPTGKRRFEVLGLRTMHDKSEESGQDD